MTNTENDQRGTFVAAPRSTENEKRERAEYLSKWLMRMFWWNLPIAFFLVLTRLFSETDFPVVYHISCACVYVFYLPAMLICLKLSKKEKTFFPAGVCYLIICIFNAIGQFFHLSGHFLLGICFYLLTWTGAQVTNYFELEAYRKVVKGVDDRLARVWRRTWWVVFGSSFLDLGTVPFLLVSEIAYQTASTVAFLGTSATMLVTQILLYKTAMVLKQTVQGEEKLPFHG